MRVSSWVRIEVMRHCWRLPYDECVDLYRCHITREKAFRIGSSYRNLHIAGHHSPLHTRRGALEHLMKDLSLTLLHAADEVNGGTRFRIAQC
jgi:hypothetical protein